MLSARNEWIAIAVLLVIIAFVPCPMALKEFYGTPIGKAVVVAAVVYAWKYVSQIVAVLLILMVLRGSSIREFLDEAGMTPPSAPTPGAGEFKCPEEFLYVSEKKMCMKGNESKAPECEDKSMMWDSEAGACISKAPATPPAEAPMPNGGPAGGTTPGAAAAQNEVANAMATTSVASPTVESFTPYGGKATGDFAPV